MEKEYNIYFMFQTTGWAVTGELTLISFDKEKNVACEGLPRNSFCAVYDNGRVSIV